MIPLVDIRFWMAYTLRSELVQDGIMIKRINKLLIFLWLSCHKVSIWIGKYRHKNRYPECHFQRTEKNGPISAGENGFEVFKGQTISHFSKT